MTHPAEADLALYASGDLAWWRQWQAERHVRRCGPCKQTAAAYSEFRSQLDRSDERKTPHWNRMALEMTANIRLGLAAGECVTRHVAPRPLISGVRLTIAGGLLATLICVGAWINRPHVGLPGGQRFISGTVLEASESGIQVRGTEQTLRILTPVGRNVICTVGSQGELRARSLDPETGNVAITHVYGE